MRSPVLAVLLLTSLSFADGQAPPPLDANALVQRIQAAVLAPTPPPESKSDPNVPHGEMLGGVVTSTVYPGTANSFQVYVPAQYDPAKPACLLVKLDGLGGDVTTVLDNMIAKKELPVIIGVGISPGMVFQDQPARPGMGIQDQPVQPPRAMRYNRSFEFDGTNDYFPNYVTNELLPAVQKLKTQNGREIRLSPDGNDHMVMGASSGGIGAFTLAWLRPDQFRRVYSMIGTFVPMRGGNEYAVLVRKTEPKPIRVFLEDGTTDAWNAVFGLWYDANVNLESALRFAGYDVGHAWGTHGHDGGPGMAVFPDVMRWMWRDYPGEIRPLHSDNDWFYHLVGPGEGWQKTSQAFRGATSLASDAKGDVYVSDPPAATLSRIRADGSTSVFLANAPVMTGICFGPDAILYGCVPGGKKIVAIDGKGSIRIVADGIAGHAITVTHDGTLYVGEPGEHAELPSTIWKITPNGTKAALDHGLFPASGVAFQPDGALFYAAESSSQLVYSYVVRNDGSLADRQPFYWLHSTDLPHNSGAEDMASDKSGNLYVATRMGIQVCDLRGEVRAILPLPSCLPVRSLCFGGPNFDELYATDGTQVFKRKLLVPGVAPWMPPVPLPAPGGA